MIPPLNPLIDKRRGKHAVCRKCDRTLTKCRCRRQNGKGGHGRRGVQGPLTGSTQPEHKHRKAKR